MKLRILGDNSLLWQWDTGQKLIVEDDGTCNEVHFCNNRSGETALVRPIMEKDGLRLVDIPNILLQKANPLTAFLYHYDADGSETRYSYNFPVRARPKPESYVYTETEVLNYAYLDERLKNLEGEGLANAVADYLKEKPIEAGATAEEAAQIQHNKTDIEQLAKAKLDADKLPEAVNDALAQAKASGEFKGEKGDPGEPGAPGEDGGYYTPKVEQTDANTMKVSYTASKSGMPAVAEQSITLPAGPQGEPGTVTPEQIASAVEDYMAEHPVGEGLTTEQITALDNMFKVCAFIKEDVSAEYTAFKAAFGITESGGEEEPDEPVVPEVTLTSISAVYDGGDVAVGTAVTDLTGIVVTAHYSDGSSEAVTGYALSGEIAEGENTITVSYQGKTTAFTVNGITESTGENNGWVDGQAYELNKVDCLSLDTATGETVAASEGTMVTDFLPCLGVSAISWTGFDTASILNSVLYDEEKNFIKANGLLNATDPAQGATNVYATLKMYSIVPEGTAYLRLTQRSSIKYITSVTPHKYPVLTETTECETGRWYESGAVPGYLNSGNGTISSDDSWFATGYCMVYGASKVHFSTYTRKTVVFYDGNKNYISGATVNNTTAFEVPENAVYMAASSTDMNNLHIWLEA